VGRPLAALFVPTGSNAQPVQPGYAATAAVGDAGTGSSLAAPRLLPAAALADSPTSSAAGAAARPAVKASTCSFTFSLYHGPTGHFLCGTYVRGFLLPGVAIYAFGIGTDKAVWRAYSPPDGNGGWKPSSSWASMGGVATNGTWAWTDLSFNAAVQVRGTDANLWCRYWPYQGSWGSWFMCNGWKANGSEITFAHG
jgi:hypothetical protein